ncbi:MAG: hypothetical protein RBR70_10850 [Arcobacter sp.]|jgi:hypothetical protein|nr:hypothetical protein [Arcobacter sp.]MDD3008996.1 hypothetical protein [Arcobacter sp.]MDY3205557.1 hypothetical protein [Arcobacter sp.]
MSVIPFSLLRVLIGMLSLILYPSAEAIIFQPITIALGFGLD